MAICSNRTCDRDVGKRGAKGLCPMHYRQTRKSQDSSIRTKANYSELMANMKTRCYNKNTAHYKDYGGRGIKICDRWLASLDNFIEDMGSTYFEGATIERKNVNGNYEPSNCVWATFTEQANNRRSNKVVTYNGKTQNLEQWIRELGLKSSTVRQRIYGLGWSIEEAFTIPKGRRRIAS